MRQLTKLRIRHQGLGILAYSFTGGAGLLFTLLILGPDSQNSFFRVLQENSLDFFVRCNSSRCSAPIIPFTGYLLNLGQNLDQFFLLWLAINTGLNSFYFYQLAKRIKHFKYQLPLIIVPLVLVTINTLYPTVLIALLPCILSILVALTLKNNSKNSWPFFVTISALFDLLTSLILLISLVCFLITVKEGRQARRDVVKILKSFFLACVIIYLYLLLIDYNFFNVGINDIDQGTPVYPIERLTTIALSYFIAFITFINLYANKIK